jgi:hypothetical protein
LKQLLETHQQLQISHPGFKASEALLGIETFDVRTYLEAERRFKASEALLGIETQNLSDRVLAQRKIQSL